MTSRSQTSSKILVVEDDDDLREELRELLVGRGFEVILAENGEAGLAALRANANIRAIVLDVAMPVMNGATFRGEQLADPAVAEIPVVLLSGRDDLRAIGRALGAIACVRKPCSDELVRTLEQCRVAEFSSLGRYGAEASGP